MAASPHLPRLRRGPFLSREAGEDMKRKFLLTLFLVCSIYPSTPPNRGPAHDGELGGVEGRPARVVQRNPHSRGPRRRPGGITTSAPQGKATDAKGIVT